MEWSIWVYRSCVNTRVCVWIWHTVNNKKAVKWKNTSVYLVVQWLTIVACSTVNLSAVHVKFVNNSCTCSCVLSSPAMNCPVPNGYVIDATINATIPGYKNRLKWWKTFSINTHISLKKITIYLDWISKSLLFLQKHIHFLIGSHKHDILTMNPNV